MSIRKLRLAVGAVIAIALAAAAWAAGPLAEPTGRTPLPPIERATAGTQCVADPAVMRRDHPQLLKHQRNETVHRGVRDTRSSLKGCIGCHASTTTGSVAQAKTDFCVSCHSYAAVKVDCFECHASKPQSTAFHRLVDPQASVWGAQLEEQLRSLVAQRAQQP